MSWIPVTDTIGIRRGRVVKIDETKYVAIDFDESSIKVKPNRWYYRWWYRLRHAKLIEGRKSFWWREKHQGHWHASWTLFYKARHAGIGYVADAIERDHMFYLNIPALFNIWLRIPMSCKRAEKLKYECKGWEVRFHSGSAWFTIGHNDSSWSSKQKWWKSFNINFADIVLGKFTSKKGEVVGMSTWLPLPEKNYPVDIELYDMTCGHKRWFKRTTKRACVTIQEGVQGPLEPGKGENSWDIDDSDTSSWSFQANSFEEAIGHVVSDVLEGRARRGAGHWYPEPKDESHMAIRNMNVGEVAKAIEEGLNNPKHRGLEIKLHQSRNMNMDGTVLIDRSWFTMHKGKKHGNSFGPFVEDVEELPSWDDIISNAKETIDKILDSEEPG